MPAQQCTTARRATFGRLCQDRTCTPILRAKRRFDDKGRYLPIIAACRKPGALVPLELAICQAAAALRADGHDEFHGYQIAKTIGDGANARLLTAYGTLYRALGRLEKMGLLHSRWEDPAIPARENRPGRRLYVLTAPGDAALREARAAEAAARRRTRRRLAPA